MNATRDEQITERYESGESSLSIGRDLGISSTRVRQILQVRGVPRRDAGGYRKHDHEQIVRLYQASNPTAEIASKVDCSISTVCSVLKSRGFDLGQRPTIDTDEILRLYTDEGLKQTQIAEQMGIAQPTVSKWITAAGLTYKDRGRE